MKLRNGFVSNSSSSSFVLIGIELSLELTNNKILGIMTRSEYTPKTKQGSVYYDDDLREEFRYDFPNKTGLVVHEGSEDGVVGTVAGYRITDSGESGHLEEGSVSIQDIKDKETKLKYIFDTDSEVKVFYGTRMC